MYFLGLTVPHAARAICGPDQRWVLAYSAVLGAALLLFADVIGRVLVRPSELQAGRDAGRRRRARVHRARAPEADRRAVMASRRRDARIPGRVVRVGGGLSLRVQPRPVVVAALLACLTLALAVFAIGTGEFAIAPGAVVTALLGGGDAGTAFIVRELRLPAGAVRGARRASRSASPARSSSR